MTAHQFFDRVQNGVSTGLEGSPADVPEHAGPPFPDELPDLGKSWTGIIQGERVTPLLQGEKVPELQKNVTERDGHQSYNFV